MAEVKLRIIADDTALNPTLAKATEGFSKLGQVSKKTLTEQKQGFKEVADAAEEANQEIASPEPKVQLDKNANSIKGLKDLIKEYTNAAIAAGTTTPIGQEFLRKAAEAKDKLEDIRASVAGLAKDTRVFAGLTEGATTAAAAFSLFQGASALLGDENKDLQKTLTKLTATTAILNGLTQIQNALQKESALRLLATSVASKTVAVAQAAYSTVVGVMTGQLSLATVATNVLNVATKALLGPFGLLLAAGTAVAGAFAFFSSAGESAADAIKRLTKEQQDLNAELENGNKIRQAAIDLIKVTTNNIKEQTSIQLDSERAKLKALESSIEKQKEIISKSNGEAKTEAEKQLADLQAQLEAAQTARLTFVQTSSDEELQAKLQKQREANDILIQLAESHGADESTVFKLKLKKLNDDILLLQKTQAAELLEEQGGEINKFSAQDEKLLKQLLAEREVIQKQFNDNLKKDFIERLEIQNQGFKDDIELQKRNLKFKANLDMTSAELTISDAGQLANKRLEIQSKLIDELTALDIEALKKTAEIEKQKVSISTKSSLNKALLLTQIEKKLANDIALLELTAKEDRIRNTQAEFDALAKISQDQTDKEVEQLEKLIKKKKDAEEDAFNDIQKLTLLRAENKLNIIKAEIRNEIELRDKELKTLEAKFNGGLITAEEFERKKEIIVRESNKKIKDLNEQSLKDLISLGQEIGGIFDSIVNEQIEAQQTLLDKKKELNEEELQANEQKLEELQDQLQTELQLNQQGFASNVSLVRAEIEAKKKERERELAEQKKLQEQQTRLDQARRLQESANQASSLATSSANIYKVLSELGPAGVALAIVAISAMVGSFVAAKLKIAEATKLSKGSKLEGPTHDEGGIPLYEAEGGEWVINKRSSAKYDPILKAINSDTSPFTPPDYRKLLAGTGVTLSEDLPVQIIRNTTEVRNAQAAAALSTKGVESRLQSMEASMTNFFGYYKAKPQTSESGGKKIVRQGNITIIKKRRT